MQITDEQIAKLKADNPGKQLHLVRACGTDVVFRTPDDAAWTRFLDESGRAEGRHFAMLALCSASLAFPAREQFMALVAQQPGLVQTFASQLVEIAGVSRVEEVRKL